MTGEPSARKPRDPLTARMMEFLAGIGLAVRYGEVGETTVVPGIDIEHGVIVVDEARLKWPGDLLHEAGHLAVVPADRRSAMHATAGDDGGEEMAAIAWSYAAAIHLGIDPAVVFHDGGYRGGGSNLLENFTAGRTVGIPILQWLGMTFDEKRARTEGVAPYPHMLRWLREG